MELSSSEDWRAWALVSYYYFCAGGVGFRRQFIIFHRCDIHRNIATHAWSLEEQEGISSTVIWNQEKFEKNGEFGIERSMLIRRGAEQCPLHGTPWRWHKLPETSPSPCNEILSTEEKEAIAGSRRKECKRDEEIEQGADLRISTYLISPEKEKNSFMFSAVAESGMLVTLIVLT